MELIFEILFEFLIDCCLEVAISKNKNMLLRGLAILVVFIIYGGIVAVFLFIALKIIKDNIVGGCVLIAIACLILGSVIYAIVKKCKTGQDIY